MKEQKKNSLRHLAELISQNKHLEEDNLKLSRQVDNLSEELDRYKNLVTKYNLEKKGSIYRKDKEPNILKFKMATVLFADAQGFTELSDDMDSSHLVDSLDEIFLELGTIINKH
jgi:adenylate cyclase